MKYLHTMVRVADALLAEHEAAQRSARDKIEHEKTRPRRGRVLGFFSLVAAFFGAGSR